MTTKRMTEASTALVATMAHVNTVQPGSDAEGMLRARAADATARVKEAKRKQEDPDPADVETLAALDHFKNGLRAGDAVNWGVKVLRELRNEMLAGRKLDLDGMAKAAAEHFGTDDVAAVKAFLLTEQEAFAKEIAAAAKDVKAGRKKYSLGDVLNPVQFFGKSPAQIAAIIAEHQAIPVDEFVGV